MKIILFEDQGFQNLLPLSYFRPVWDLRCGAGNLAENAKSHLTGSDFYYVARDYLAANYLKPENRLQWRDHADVLLLNGRLLLNDVLARQIQALPPNQVLCKEQAVVAVRLQGIDLRPYFSEGVLLSERVLTDFPCTAVEATLMDFPWDFIDRNGAQIVDDFSRSFARGRIDGRVDPGVILLNEENIYIATGARVMPGVVLNAENGPIWIEKNATVMPNSVLEGPLYIGPGSRIKIGAKIYENTSIGPVCKVGGEVEETIIQEYSNKQHDGFLGHSFLGAWVNIGADTNNSDLKNNYGEITVFVNGKPVNSGKRFLGLVMGDHSKTAINTMFNTGTIVGVSCNVYGEGFPPKFIPSFSWGGSGGLRAYQFEKAVEVAKIVMGRRQVPFTSRDLNLFNSVKELAEKIENRNRVKK